MVELDYDDGDLVKLEWDEIFLDDSKGDCSFDFEVKFIYLYIVLIVMVILSCLNKKMILGDIY